LRHDQDIEVVQTGDQVVTDVRGGDVEGTD